LFTQTSIPPHASSTRRASLDRGCIARVAGDEDAVLDGAPRRGEAGDLGAGANACATAAPIPLEAPVTTTRRPRKSNGDSIDRL
jgi:hypothetical protein